MIEELKLEDYDTRMIEEKIQNLELEKKKVIDEVSVFRKLLATRKPNALDKMMAKRKREDYLKTDSLNLKEDLKEQFLDAERKKVHIILTTEQKKRVVELSETFGPTKAEELTGVDMRNIMWWQAQGKENLHRKKGSGRKVHFPDFEKKLLDYFKETRKKGIGLSTRKFILYARSEVKKDQNVKIKFSRDGYKSL